MADEHKSQTAMNGMRARRFGGAVNYSRSRAAATPTPAPQPMEQEADIPPVTQHFTATSVQAPAPTINTAMPSVPNVQPTAPTAPTIQPTQAQGAAPGNGMTFGASPMTRPTPTQLNARPLPPAPGVTADPMTNPYAYIEQLYGRRETAAEKAERERKEYNRQRISNWLSVLGGIGNMLVTSGNRYGRAVKSPDFAKAAAKGIMTNEMQRRANEESRLEAIQKQQQLDAQREKMRRDAEERAWNRAFLSDKAKAEQDFRNRQLEYNKSKDIRQQEYVKQRDAERLAFEREKHKQDVGIRYSQLAAQRENNAARLELIKAQEQRRRTDANRNRTNRDEVVLPHPNYPEGIHVAKSVWNGPTQGVVLQMLMAEDKARTKERIKEWRDKESATNWRYRHFKSGAKEPKPRSWFDEVFGKDVEPDTAMMITAYLAAHPDSEASMKAIEMLQRMSGIGQANDVQGQDSDDNLYGPDGPFYNSDEISNW